MVEGSTEHRATFRFVDGVESSVIVRAGDAVLDAALAGSVQLLHQCRSGNCASCTARLVAGDAPMRGGQASVLTAGEAAQGVRLLCRTEMRSDAIFQLDYDSTASGAGPRKARAFVDAVERIAVDAVRLQLELAEGSWIDFKPGQYIQLSVPGTDVRRSYSIASTPAQLPRIDLLIRLLPGGAMSEWLKNDAKPDTVIDLEGPFGAFTLKEKVDGPHILIAGGTGLAPMMSMIDAIRSRAGRKPRILLSFGCASEQSLFYLNELELRCHWMPALDVRLSIDRGAEREGLRIGNPVAAIVADDVHNPDSVAYLCGPPGLIAAAQAYLVTLGLKAENIRAEQFVASQ
jgi:benzoate/toluate 1,2-dioxygenase reductase subunit